jgi:excinuclease ABC subunit C
VYFFKKGASILYIGKATSLKDRVRSYFNDDLIKTRGRLLVDMISQADTLSWRVTDSVLEAFILETELIKKNQPRYNTKEKDNKSFNYVVFTQEDFPRVLVVRGRNLELSNASSEKQKELLGYTYTHVFGPYPFGAELREALKLIRKIFPYRDKCEPCVNTKVHIQHIKTDGSRIITETHERSCKPCFNRTLGLCPGVCTGEMNKTQYAKRIKELILFFKGEKIKVVHQLKKEMQKAAKEMRFEEAGEIKKTLHALSHIHDISLIKKESEFGTIRSYNVASGTVSGKINGDAISGENNSIRVEAYDIAHTSGKNMIGALVVLEDGQCNKAEYKIFNIQSVDLANDTAALKEVLVRRFAHREWQYPNTVVIDGGKAQLKVAKETLDLIKGAERIEVVSVVKDETHKAREILRIRGIRSGAKNPAGPITEEEAVRINAECHRFAIKTHRNKRGKQFLSQK